MGQDMAGAYWVDPVRLCERPLSPGFEGRRVNSGRTFSNRLPNSFNQHADILGLAQKLPAHAQVFQAPLIELF